MPQVLTENSTLVCAQQGKVQLQAGQSKLTVNGNKVLVDGDLSGKTIGGCSTVNDSTKGNKLCTTVASAISGVASKLKINGSGVLLENINGQTDGTVGGATQTWLVQNAGQTKLKTV